MKSVVLAACCFAGAVALAAGLERQAPKTPATKGSPMDTIAEQYVKLVLAMGQHDADYVDAYYGPPQWKKDAEVSKLDLDAIGSRARVLTADLDRLRQPEGGGGSGDEMSRLREQYLERQLSALSARVRILKGERLSFDDESKALYDAVAPTYPESHFQEILDRLEKRFPGPGPLVASSEQRR